MDADGTNARKLTASPNDITARATRSPDSRKTVFSAVASGEPGMSVYVASADGTGVAMLSDKTNAIVMDWIGGL